MESSCWLVNQCLALSPSESRNNLNLSASSITPLYLTVSHTSMKFSQMRVRILAWQTVELNVLKHLQVYYFQLKIVRLNR